MSKIFKAISAIVLASASIAANASIETKDLNKGFYAGLKSGALSVSASEYDFDTPIAIQAGYAIGLGFSIETEYSKTDGEFSYYSYPRLTLSADLTTLAVYGVYRTPGNFYGKFKAGVLNEEVSVGSTSLSATGFSAGAGVGFRFNDHLSAEAEYTLIEADVDFLSLGINFHF